MLHPITSRGVTRTGGWLHPERPSAACSGLAHNGNTAQALLLTKIEGRELALRDIIERGYYIGFDASYNIKQLLEADYVVQKRSVHDKRSVKVSLTEKGEELCKKLVTFNAAQAERLAGSKETTAQLNATMDVLRNLENSWSEYLRYGSV